MQCPNCVTETLAVTHRQDVEIDHCPKCGGVWLDRGELDKLLKLDAEQMRRTRGYEEGGEDQDEQERIQRRGRQYNQYEEEGDEEGEGAFGEEGAEEDGDEQPRQPSRYGRRQEDDDERERPTYGRDSRDRTFPRSDRTGPGRDRYDRPPSGGDDGQIDLKSIWRDILENLGGGQPPVK